MEKRRFESFEVFSCLGFWQLLKDRSLKKWEKHRAHKVSTRKEVNIFTLSVRSLGKQLVLSVSLEFVSGNIRARGKTKLFPEGPDI